MDSSNTKDEEVVLYLKSFAALESYYLHKFQSGRHLIHYFDGKGQSWSLMEDDEAFLIRCVEFLKRINVPEFDDVESIKNFEAEMLKKYKSI